MASVNRLILLIGFPAVFLAYFAFLGWEHWMLERARANKAQIIADHYANVEVVGPIDGLILGGSNAYFSLSAELIGEKLGTQWYNAALINEGYSDHNYEAFIRQLGQRLDFDRITQVVYSNYQPYDAGGVERRLKAKEDLAGSTGLHLKPLSNALSYAEAVFGGYPIPGGKIYPAPTQWGDFQFGDYPCIFTPNASGRQREDVAVAADYLVGLAGFLSDLFPNAQIFVVLPSTLSGAVGASVDDGTDQFETDLQHAFVTALQENRPQSAQRVSLIVQPPYPSMDHVCDASHHANAVGRDWRSRDLAGRLEAS